MVQTSWCDRFLLMGTYWLQDSGLLSLSWFLNANMLGVFQLLWATLDLKQTQPFVYAMQHSCADAPACSM
jgi:hypothetical protein